MDNESEVQGNVSVENEILAYLVAHPSAQDTFEGIFQWWVLETRILHKQREVREALSGLVEKGYLSEMQREDSSTCYRINSNMAEKIAVLFGDQQGGNDKDSYG